MAKEDVKQQDKKGGGLFSWFRAKPAPEAISAIASDLSVSVEVTDKGKARLSFSSENRSTISKLVKALEREGADIPEGYLPRSIVFHDQDNIDQVTKVLERVHSAPKSIKFPPLKDRVSEEDMAGLDNRDLFALNNQRDVTMKMIGSIVKLAVRDKTDAMAASKRRAEEPQADPRSERKTARKAVPQSGAAVVETAAHNEQTEAEFIPDSVDLGAQYNVVTRNGPQGGLVVSHESFTSEEAWLADLKELREAVGNSGVVTIQRYQNSKNEDVRGFIIKGLPADQLVEAGTSLTSKEDLIRNIQAAAYAEHEYVTKTVEDDVKSAVFYFPKGKLTEERQQGFVADLQAAFGDDGQKYVSLVSDPADPEKTGFKVIGITKEELVAGGGAPISNSALIAKLYEEADRIKTETPIADTPDASKSVVLLFPKELPQERRDSYIDELRSMYPENGDKFVRSYNSKGDIQVTGIKINGTSKEELFEKDRKKIGNKELVAKLQSIVTSSKAQVVSADAPEPVAEPVAVSGTGVGEQVTDFLKEVRQRNGEHTARKKAIMADKENDPTEALRQLNESRTMGISFPEDSKILVISNIDKDREQLEAMRDAFKQEGYPNTALVGGNNLYIALTEDVGGHVAKLESGSKHAEAEQNLRNLLGRAFTEREVESVVAGYKQRNPQSAGMARGVASSASGSDSHA